MARVFTFRGTSMGLLIFWLSIIDRNGEEEEREMEENEMFRNYSRFY